jgi:hypothetical protein
MSGKANSLLNKISIQRKQKYIFEDSFFSKYNENLESTKSNNTLILAN